MINKRYRYVYTLEDINNIISIAKQHTVVYNVNYEYKFEAGKPALRYASYVFETERYVKVTTMYATCDDGKYFDIRTAKDMAKYACTWIFDKSGENTVKIAPSRVAKMTNIVYKPKDVSKAFERNKDGKIVNSAKGIIGYNKKYDMTEHNCVAYDLNSAYAFVLTRKIIDTYNMKSCGRVGVNEVGFRYDSNLTMVHTGDYADYIFPLIDSPFKDFVTKWYNIKKTAPKGSEERDMAKNILTFMVGIWQNHNPFLRSYVIHSCNEIIQYIIDKYKDKVTLWNTDAVYCTEHIQELDELVGDNIGQFKVEHDNCLIRQKQNNYQIVENGKVSTTYRGVAKQAFKDNKWNILTDHVPTVVYPYYYDKKLKIIIRR